MADAEWRAAWSAHIRREYDLKCANFLNFITVIIVTNTYLLFEKTANSIVIGLFHSSKIRKTHEQLPTWARNVEIIATYSRYRSYNLRLEKTIPFGQHRSPPPSGMTSSWWPPRRNVNNSLPAGRRWPPQSLPTRPPPTFFEYLRRCRAHSGNAAHVYTVTCWTYN